MTKTEEPELEVGQNVRFSPDGHAVYDAQVMSCIWSEVEGAWEYRLQAGTYEFGPYTHGMLQRLMRLET
jgi:hypothetical protein